MHKGGKKWVKPGWAASKLSEYEKQRMNTIAENQTRMKALGLHQAANSLMNSSKKGKRNMGDRYDDEYSPPEYEEGLSSSGEYYEDHASDGDDESLGSPMQKVEPMPPKRLSARLLQPLTPTEAQTEQPVQSQPVVPQHVPVATLSITSTNIVASTTTKMATRGLTKGVRTEKLVARSGKLPVEVPDDYNVPVGPNAPSLTSELGKEIRGSVELQGIKTWNDIDISVKGAIIQRALDKFDIKDYSTNPKVQKAIDKKCQSLFRNWKCVMHRKYKQLLKNGINPKTKQPPRGVTIENWNYMIDHVWTDEQWKARSKKATKARSCVPYNHSCGSRSFPATMTMMAAANGGQKPHIVDFYKESHWSKSKNNWMHPICKEKHDEFVKVQERCSQPDAIPISQEEMSIEVLGPRPGYLRGFGVGPKPSHSSRTTAQSQAHEEEVRDLKNVVESQNRLIEAQNKKMEEFESFKAFAMKALQQAGFTPSGDNSSGDDLE